MPKSQSKPKVIGIVGSRRRDEVEDYQKLMEVFETIVKEGDRLVSGGCLQGGDRFAEYIAQRLGMTITIHHANWNGPLKKGAGFARNTLIAEDCDVLIALNAEGSKGTQDTINKVRALGKKVIEC